MRAKKLTLPTGDQFRNSYRSWRKWAVAIHATTPILSGFWFTQDAGREASKVPWADVDFVKREITVRGDAVTGTKNWKIRRVPMIDDYHELLEGLRAANPIATGTKRVIEIARCQHSIDRATKIIDMMRVTHHDFRLLFASRCIESGVNIPTVAAGWSTRTATRWP